MFLDFISQNRFSIFVIALGLIQLILVLVCIVNDRKTGEKSLLSKYLIVPMFFNKRTKNGGVTNWFGYAFLAFGLIGMIFMLVFGDHLFPPKNSVKIKSSGIVVWFVG